MSHRRSLTQTPHARVTEGRGSTRRGTVGACCIWGTKIRRLTLHKHDWSLCSFVIYNITSAIFGSYGITIETGCTHFTLSASCVEEAAKTASLDRVTVEGICIAIALTPLTGDRISWRPREEGGEGKGQTGKRERGRGTKRERNKGKEKWEGGKGCGKAREEKMSPHQC